LFIVKTQIEQAHKLTHGTNTTITTAAAAATYYVAYYRTAVCGWFGVV